MYNFEGRKKANTNCRHYDYKYGTVHGPTCAKGLVFAHGETVLKCLPNPKEACVLRENYTDAERASARLANAPNFERLSNVLAHLATLPPIGVGETGKVDCPNCNRQVHYSRSAKHAAICCTTQHCVIARLTLKAGVEWP